MKRTLKLTAMIGIAATVALSFGIALVHAAPIPAQEPSAPGSHPLPQRVRSYNLPQGLIPPAEEEEVGEAGGNPFSQDYMVYRGGPVQTSPHVYLVFWGKWSAAADRYRVGARLFAFFSGIGGSVFNHTVTQYAQGCQVNTYVCGYGAVNITNPAGQLKGAWNDRTNRVPITPTPEDVWGEALRARFGDYSVNAQYVIALPHGHGDELFKSDTACAWHSSGGVSFGRTVQFMSLPYMPDAGESCGNYSVTNSITDGVTIVASHEYIETETDPWVHAGVGLQGWNDSSGGQGEVGDKCAWEPGSQLTQLNTGTFPVQAVWSNYDRYFYGNGCVFSD